ncbi:hypothetical protein ACQ4LE_007334 [Meloidogyne hapla]|uniref:Secreted protein n=1 Tax=Meloidogyne hapla TaxID=6305 RepID=A0A1I8BW85_MELHA
MKPSKIAIFLFVVCYLIEFSECVHGKGTAGEGTAGTSEGGGVSSNVQGGRGRGGRGQRSGVRPPVRRGRGGRGGQGEGSSVNLPGGEEPREERQILRRTPTPKPRNFQAPYLNRHPVPAGYIPRPEEVPHLQYGYPIPYRFQNHEQFVAFQRPPLHPAPGFPARVPLHQAPPENVNDEEDVTEGGDQSD